MSLTGLLLGALLGFVLQRGRFCVTGAFRDVFLARKTRWLTAFLIVIAVQSVGVFALQSAGIIELSFKALPWLAVIVGSLIFGISIVLAGGCATGTYYRAGEGLVGSWVALVAYAGFAAVMKYGVLKPVNDGMRAETVPVTTVQDSLGISPWFLVVLLVAGVGYLAYRQLRSQPKLKVATLPPEKTGLNHLLFEKAWHPFVTAVIIGLIAIAAYPLSYAAGREAGLGITTPSANLTSFLVTGNTARIDWGVWLVVGILVGSFIAAKGAGEFKIRVPDSRTIVRSIAGGVGMGVGASLAGGCTIGNAMVETAQFSYQGWIAFALMFLGTGIGARLFITGRRSKSASGTPQQALVNA
ncbi:sulfur transporter [Enemella evansiae]|uniref:YeeE/YedE family protein n=1 Tax=Enemella evansiae TaxID=2016499 RepID=UPI000B962C0C|nr:YeeE/YedE family protein [Enemella evansiae]OYO00498.1 sulfur transporter [Enemella evansiae]OYO16958.1 sulfur transporter [Enemella evansiae]